MKGIVDYEELYWRSK